MKMNRTFLIAGLLLGATAGAQDTTVPRGPDIGDLAANCGLGPFDQTTKAGIYNGLCEQLTDAEKCLALVKQSMSAEGVLSRPQGNQPKEKVSYCLDVFEAAMILQSRVP